MATTRLHPLLLVLLSLLSLPTPLSALASAEPSSTAFAPPQGALQGIAIGFSAYQPASTFGSGAYHPSSLDEHTFADQAGTNPPQPQGGDGGGGGGGWTPTGGVSHPTNLNSAVHNQAPLGGFGVQGSSMPAPTQYGLRASKDRGNREQSSLEA